MADRDSGARRALPGEGTGMSGVEGLAEQLAVAVKALERIAATSPYREPGDDWVHWREQARRALVSLRGAA